MSENESIDEASEVKEIKEIVKEKEEKKEEEKKVKTRGPGKIPSIIIEKMEEKDDERFMTIRFSPKHLKTAPLWKRSRRAMKLLADHIYKHVKYVEATIDETTGARAKVRITEPILWISPQINEIIWSRGSKNPPKKIRVRVLIKVEEILRDSEGRPTGCRAELKVFPI